MSAYSRTAVTLTTTMVRNAQFHSVLSNGTQYTKKPRSAPVYGTLSSNGAPERARTNVVQLLCGIASSTPRMAERITAAVIR